MLSEENKVPRTLSEGGMMAGSATCKQSKAVGTCVCLGLLIQSCEQRQFVYFRHKKKNQTMKIFLSKTTQCTFKVAL